jgi:hypothetical protein
MQIYATEREGSSRYTKTYTPQIEGVLVVARFGYVN